ncbi:homeodomain-interacting protein kinase 2-like [Xyrichtys novacula]|uniref:Homeodomain-interacting protein kinase 2-like n=1 Tax=Xyrichtys novacula TaxID=13765 RepID=A0AAV1GBN7_XYRNO|nr:homeodomain-interacting protein kinase 2-like [Xyrichtys novacula]
MYSTLFSCGCFKVPVLLSENRLIIQQVANALDHLKTIGMIHADLKLDNVMLVDHQHQPYRVKVIDFGLAEDVSATRLGSCIQTRPYRSPEILLGLPYTEAIDMWSLGVMAASMYLGTFLYPGRSEFDMIRSLKSDTPADRVLEMWDKEDFLDMLKGMLQLDAAERLTPCQVLEHPFITMSDLTGRIPYTS